MRLRTELLVLIFALMVPVAVNAQGGPTANGTYSVAAAPNDCAAGENCYRLRIRCTTDPGNPAIPLRFRPPAPGRTEFSDVVIRESGISPASQPAGGVVFFTGSYGDFFYGNGIAADLSPADQTVSIIGSQYTAFEVKWLNADTSELSTNVVPPGNPIGAVNQRSNPGTGYVSGSEGYGSLADKCGVREVLEWISTNKTPRGDQKLCATGNSGGGAQIGYALTVYGGADYLKSTVMTAGPPYSKIFNGCFDTLYNNGLNAQGFPDGTVPSMTLGLGGAGGGRRQLEQALGWPANTCVRLNPFSLDPAKKLFTQRTSLAAVDDNGVQLEFRDYAARDKSNVLTNQYFVRSSMDDGGAQIQGDAYLAQLSAAGGLFPGAVDDVVAANGGSPPDYLQHTTHDTPSGAAKIRNFLMSNNNCTYSSVPTPFSVNPGGFSMQSSGKSTSPVTVGYGRIQPNSGGASPSGLAIFAFRQGGTLVSEAGVPATPLIRSGRTYAEINNSVNTGVAIANPNAQDAAVSFYFTDQNGNFGNGSMVVPAGGHIAAFLDQKPFYGRSPLSGTLTFDSSVPVAVVALRGLTNERQEFLITTLPVIDLSAAASRETVVFPHFADGVGWTTQLVLVNPTDNTLTGSVQFIDVAGLPATVGVGVQSGSAFEYTIPPRSSQKLETLGVPSPVLVGSVRVVPAANAVAPAGVAVFSFRNNLVTVAEAGVPAVKPAAAFRVYAEASGIPGAIGSIQTGLAVSNLSTGTATVTLELTTLSGTSTGLVGSLTIPPNGQRAIFLNQVQGLGSLPLPFQGVLRVSSPSPISMVALRGRHNERSDFLITTIPSVDESAPASSSALYFPHIADSGGYTTQFILFSGSASQSSGGSLTFFKQSGSEWTLSLR